mmetsp:Transcript_51681/g.52084  ORF Transcript_51681/g.52084 Transcript_51681/m.52084 type:complete len:114 (-) Transcript_51681:1059-1400(-)
MGFLIVRFYVLIDRVFVIPGNDRFGHPRKPSLSGGCQPRRTFLDIQRVCVFDATTTPFCIIIRLHNNVMGTKRRHKAHVTNYGNSFWKVAAHFAAWREQHVMEVPSRKQFLDG